MGWELRESYAVSTRGGPTRPETVGDDFIVIFRIAAMDMLQGGMSWDEIALLAKELEKAGASIISTHFVWHEANVPTIATMVPRAAFTRVTARVRKKSASLSSPLTG